MIRDRFSYQTPRSIDEALDLLADAGDDAAVMAGGTWVVWEMTSGRRRPSRVIDLSHAGLAGVATDDGSLSIGPMTTYTDLAASAQVPPLLRQMAAGITGGAQIRNQGTIGGSLCYAFPSSDAAGALVAVAARVRIRSPRGTRDVDVTDFVTGAFETDLAADELVTAILVPASAPGTRFGYAKFKVCESSWPIVTAGCTLTPQGDLERLAVGGAAPRPFTVPVDGATDDEVDARTRDAVPEGYADVHASAAYRRRIAGVMAKRALAAARAKAEEART